MGLLIILLVAELFFLWLITRRMIQNIYTAIFLLSRSRPVAISILSVLLFPGTIIHELAHLFVAEILGVRTSGLTLVPEGLENTEVRTGSVSIAKSDPIRRAIIGVAPVFVGLAALGTISYFLTLELSGVTLFEPLAAYNDVPVVSVLLGYLLFAVSNTMFSSPEDMDGFLPVAVVVTLILAALYIIGIRITLTDTILSGLQTFFSALTTNIGWVAGLNVLLFFLSKLMIVGVEKLTKRRIIAK